MGDDILRQGKSAVIYARVSTKGQAESGVSIDTQLKACRSWCRQNGVAVVGEFHDDGVSGTTNDRDDFGMLIGAVVSKQPHYLVVYDSSRLTRKGPDELNRLKMVLDMYRCEAIYAGYGGLSGNSQAAIHLDTYKSATDSLFVKEQTKKTRDSVDKNIAEGKHVSRAVTFAFSDDIHLMPEGRILKEPREHEKKDSEGRIIKTVTQATVIKSVSDFFCNLFGITRYNGAFSTLTVKLFYCFHCIFLQLILQNQAAFILTIYCHMHICTCILWCNWRNTIFFHQSGITSKNDSFFCNSPDTSAWNLADFCNDR